MGTMLQEGSSMWTKRMCAAGSARKKTSGIYPVLSMQRVASSPNFCDGGISVMNCPYKAEILKRCMDWVLEETIRCGSLPVDSELLGSRFSYCRGG